ncbi:MAG: serine--tRNA ligase [Bacteroidales bacterium]|nr:serine--tRNA ligase [Bacteroidales bacterium]MBN2763309.1 serine--tRNA ligase [Bacteroidales bacterium]
MLTLAIIREKKEEVIQRLKVKNFNAEEIVTRILELDKTRRLMQQKQDSRQNELNTISKSIGLLLRKGQKDEAEASRRKTTEIKEEIKKISDQLDTFESDLNALLIQLPNLPHHSVPAGRGAGDNITVREGGTKPTLAENAMPHWDLARKYDVIDFELGNKITGAGFPLYKGKGAKLQRALINFFLDENQKAGYTEYMPPLMVNQDSGYGTGQLPDKDGQMYYVGTDNYYLIPTAEVPVTNIYRDVILNAADFPIKNTAYTPCFRREAGSYGKDVRGLNRLHQFDKVEIVQIQHPGKSYDALEEMVNHVESLVRKLELPYRIIKLCGGDMSFTSALTYDFEVYAAAQKRWLEVSSVSNFESFQANRLKLRYKEEGNKKPALAHTLNGSSLALPRIVAALLENNQTAEGIKLPVVLHSYAGFDLIS